MSAATQPEPLEKIVAVTARIPYNHPSFNTEASTRSATVRRGLKMAERQATIEELFQRAEAAIDGITRRKFRASLSASDGREENQNALEFAQQIKLLVWEKLSNPEGKSIRDVPGYAAQLTYNQWSQRIRQENPGWVSLKNRLRYFFRESTGFATWPTDQGETLCGYASWQSQKSDAKVPVGTDKFQADARSILPEPLFGKPLRQLKRRDWEELMEAIFDHLDAPVEIDELVSLISDLFGVKDHKVLSINPPAEAENARPALEAVSDGPTPEEGAMQQEYLRRLWQAVCQLKPTQRIAYLLNLRDADGDLSIFTWHGIAGLVEIGRAVNLSDEQFDRAWEQLPLDETTRSEYQVLHGRDEKFAALFRHLPVDDLLIARLIDGERQQVINLRRLARDKLARLLEVER